MQRRRKQLLTCNTPSFKGYSWCFITYSVLTGKKQEILFLKRKTCFSVSLDGPLSTYPIAFCLSFLFHNNNSITMNKFKKWATIRMFYSYISLEIWGLTLGVIVTRPFRPKSGPLNKRVYCKPIDRTLKMIYIHWRVGQLSKINYFWVMEITGFWIKKKHKYNKTLKIFSLKSKSFHNLQKISESTVLNRMAVYRW